MESDCRRSAATSKSSSKNSPAPALTHAVFHLEVHNEHVYFVGENSVLVHNSGRYADVDPGAPFDTSVATLYHWPHASGTGHIAIGAEDSYLSISPSRIYGEQLNELTGTMRSQTGRALRFDNRTSPALLHSLVDDIKTYGAPRILYVPGSDSIAAQTPIASIIQDPLYRLHGNLGSGQCAINCVTTAVDVPGAANPRLQNLGTLKNNHAYSRQLEELLQNRLHEFRTGNP